MQYLQIHRTVIISSFMQTMHLEKKKNKEAYEGISLKEMDKEDVSRQRYYNYYTGRTWGDPLNYDLMINTGKIDLEDAADLIIDYIEKVQSE